jgi:hypothetical protein
MKELTIALLMWISSHTPMTYDGSHFPNVVAVPHDRLVHILYEGDLPQGLDPETVSVAGLYNFRDRNIYLLEDEDLTTIEGQAVLIHELVHYLQYHHGIDKQVECMRELESAAYATQAKFLAQHDQEAPLNDMHVLLVSTCGHW